MATSWITLFPGWYVKERQLLARHYPHFRPDEQRLRLGQLVLYGDLVVRPAGGARKHPVKLEYPNATPYEHPHITPLESLPQWTAGNAVSSEPRGRLFDYRHQMADGHLCLFQRETRELPGGDVLTCLQVLRRAEQWFLGHHTGRWPPDTAQSELESHFGYAADILVADTFYREDLDGHGRLFLTPDIRRRPGPTNAYPLILTALTKEKGIIQTFDARCALSRVYPWITDPLWDATQLAAAQELPNLGECIIAHGYWWALPQEPSPFRDGAGLLRALEAVSGADGAWNMVLRHIDKDLHKEGALIIGLRFPARQGGIEWLFLCMERKPRGGPAGIVLIRGEAKTRQLFEASPVYMFRANRLEPSVLRLRNRGSVAEGVGSKKVVLIGLGAIGARVAELLAQAGVGNFRLCDSDRLRTGNVARHIGGVSDFGAPKTRVVIRRLLEVNPYLEFRDDDVIEDSIVKDLDRLARFMADADLTICTTADENVESAVNEVAVLQRSAVLYGRAIRRAKIGRVFLARAGLDACKSCLASYLRAGREGKEVPTDWIDVPADEEDVILHECGRPVIAGSAVDLAFIASLIARVALDVLEDRVGDRNHWLWTQVPASDIDPRLASSQSTFVGRIPPNENCPSCREPDVVELIMTHEAHDMIVRTSEASPSAETGGLLIGFIDNKRRAVVLRATEPGPNAERTATCFRRDVDYCQSELEKNSDELGPRGQYIGEWHSHLALLPEPSPTDIESLFGIAQAPNYLTRCPAMVIAGLDPVKQKVAALGSWVFPLAGRMYKVPLQFVANEDAIALNLFTEGR